MRSTQKKKKTTIEPKTTVKKEEVLLKQEEEEVMPKQEWEQVKQEQEEVMPKQEQEEEEEWELIKQEEQEEVLVKQEPSQQCTCAPTMSTPAGIRVREDVADTPPEGPGGISNLKNAIRNKVVRGKESEASTTSRRPFRKLGMLPQH